MFIIRFVLAVEDAIVGIKVPKEGQFICYPNDTEGLILLHK